MRLANFILRNMETIRVRHVALNLLDRRRVDQRAYLNAFGEPVGDDELGGGGNDIPGLA